MRKFDSFGARSIEVRERLKAETGIGYTRSRHGGLPTRPLWSQLSLPRSSSTPDYRFNS